MSRIDRGRSSRPRRSPLWRPAVLAAALPWVSAAGPGEPPDTTTADTTLPAPPAVDEQEQTARAAMRAAEADLREARVMLRTGREVVGLFIGREDRTVTLRVRGEDLKIDLADAVEFEMLGPVLETYRALRAATKDDDAAGRLHLAYWLRDRGAYATALDEIESLVRAEPFNQEAVELRVWLEQQILLKTRGGSRDEAEENTDSARRKIFDFPVLTPDEINLIRVYEVNFADPPKLHISRPVVEEFIDLYGGHDLMPKDPEGREALLRRDPLTVLDLMFRVQARPLYGEVQVLDDPASMKAFRTQIHRTWLVGSDSSCASTSCHGGQEAGRLYLNNHRSNTDATVYTNFLILDRFKLKDGTPLIDYDEPANSPLLQMALPRDRSTHPHPDIARAEGRRGWKPFFRDQDDLRFRRAVEWINSMYRPRPDYPISYQPPLPRGALRMEGQPAGER